ncbi:hypothetical protein RRG08_049042 [Elysia crispata]|uniref:Uncharacterized protein n=1 Tax=Elysia crispata TaxID=231223 RepID=A0AAE0ZTN8_9GAST|nr:hypothetical protein RRG08_049042 [Elysia crispata]
MLESWRLSGVDDATTTQHAGNRHISCSCTGVRALEQAPQEKINYNPKLMSGFHEMTTDEPNRGGNFSTFRLLEADVESGLPSRHQF